MRYSGASLAFNMAGIIRAAPMMRLLACTHYSLTYVGFYLSSAACISCFRC
jgi:hypothetical protein